MYTLHLKVILWPHGSKVCSKHNTDKLILIPQGCNVHSVKRVIIGLDLKVKTRYKLLVSCFAFKCCTVSLDTC